MAKIKEKKSLGEVCGYVSEEKAFVLSGTFSSDF